MSNLCAMTKRNIKLFFKDKGMFFTSLITPVILLILYVTFLGKVYEDAFSSSIPADFNLDSKIINATVGGQLISSILAVCCITVAFCSNLLMVQDKITGAKNDLIMTPIKTKTLAMSYFFATAIITLIICSTALIVCFIYLTAMGWYLSAMHVILIIVDMILLILFGTALSSLINAPLTTSGQASAVGTIVSAGYGFICGAYMPISNFGIVLQRVLSFLPGTYGTSLIRNHALSGAFDEMTAQNVPSEVVENIKNSIDCNIYFFGNKVEIGTMYLILGISVLILIGFYVLYNIVKSKKKK